MRPKTERNNKIYKWYFEDDLSLYAIVKKLHNSITPPRVFVILKEERARRLKQQTHAQL